LTRKPATRPTWIPAAPDTDGDPVFAPLLLITPAAALPWIGMYLKLR
jgi:hypothetical protein